jgi:hypothetical protein
MMHHHATKHALKYICVCCLFFLHHASIVTLLHWSRQQNSNAYILHGGTAVLWCMVCMFSLHQASIAILLTIPLDQTFVRKRDRETEREREREKHVPFLRTVRPVSLHVCRIHRIDDVVSFSQVPNRKALSLRLPIHNACAKSYVVFCMCHRDSINHKDLWSGDYFMWI